MTRRMDILAAAVLLGGAGLAGCDSSSPAPAGPTVDAVPPAAVTELTSRVLSGTEPSVALGWRAGSEPDLAGYHIYRDTISPGSPRRARDAHIEALELAGSVVQPAFTDADVQAGTIYVYAVTAYDASGNESPRAWTNRIDVTSSSTRRGTRGEIAE